MHSNGRKNDNGARWGCFRGYLPVEVPDPERKHSCEAALQTTCCPLAFAAIFAHEGAWFCVSLHRLPARWPVTPIQRSCKRSFMAFVQVPEFWKSCMICLPAADVWTPSSCHNKKKSFRCGALRGSLACRECEPKKTIVLLAGLRDVRAIMGSPIHEDKEDL